MCQVIAHKIDIIFIIAIGYIPCGAGRVVMILIMSILFTLACAPSILLIIVIKITVVG